MQRSSRRRLLGALGAGLVAAVTGCVERLSGGMVDNEPVSTTPTGWEALSNEVDYNHDVRIENNDDTAYDITVRIVDVTTGSEAVVHEESYDVPAADGVPHGPLVFRFSTLEDQSAVRTFEIRSRFDGTDEWTAFLVKMNRCYGDVIISIRDGELEPYTVIC